MKKCISVVLLSSIILMFSCNKKEVFFKYQSIENAKWDSEQSIVFNIDSLKVDSTEKYNMYFNVIYSNHYPHQDLWLTINHNLSDTLIVESDTLEIFLSDKNGKIFGSGNTGLYQMMVPYKHDLILNSEGQYCIKVSHAMQDNKILGVERIGLIIADSNTDSE